MTPGVEPKAPTSEDITLYVVKMERWGDPELHSYLVGVYEDEVVAKGVGDSEEEWRGGKYKARIEPLVLNSCPQYVWEE